MEKEEQKTNSVKTYNFALISIILSALSLLLIVRGLYVVGVIRPFESIAWMVVGIALSLIALALGGMGLAFAFEKRKQPGGIALSVSALICGLAMLIYALFSFIPFVVQYIIPFWL